MKPEDILQAMSRAFNRAALLHAEMASQHFHNMDERRYHVCKSNMEQAHCLAKAFSMEAQEMRTGEAPAKKQEEPGEPVPIHRGMKASKRSQKPARKEPATVPTKPK